MNEKDEAFNLERGASKSLRVDLYMLKNIMMWISDNKPIFTRPIGNRGISTLEIHQIVSQVCLLKKKK